jgi:hypothetical protein
MTTYQPGDRVVVQVPPHGRYPARVLRDGPLVLVEFTETPPPGYEKQHPFARERVSARTA